MKTSCPHLRLLQSAVNTTRPSASPLLARHSSRSFTSTTRNPSQIGRTPLSIPPNVEFTVIPPPSITLAAPVSGRRNALPTVQIKGPLGELSMEVPAFIKIEHDTVARRAMVSVIDPGERKQRAMWGTSRAYLANHLIGVSEGHTCLLRMVGVGYRATVENTATTVEPEYPGQRFVSLKVGYSHPIELGIPMGVKASTPQPTRILLEGIDKEIVKSFAAKIKAWRKPEPYKGKGIFVDNETIRLKSKKIK